MSDPYYGGKIIKPIHAKEGEFVDIYWRRRNGKQEIVRCSCPPEPKQDKPDVGADVPGGGANP